MASPIRLSPLQLRDHCFTTVQVRAVPNGDPEAEPVLTPSIAFQQMPANVRQWTVALDLRLTSADPAKPFAYEAELGLQGLVEVRDGLLEGQREQLAVVNGLSILYSAAREMLLNVTSRLAHGAVNLPTVSFVEMVAQARQEKAEAEGMAAEPAQAVSARS